MSAPIAASSLFSTCSDLAPFDGPGDYVLVRRSFAFWQSRRRVHGTIMWGRPTEGDVVEMCNAWDAHLQLETGPDPALADIRGLESIDVLAFQRLLRTFGEKHASWSQRTGPQAILHGGGLPGAAILGALQLAGPGFRLAAFDAQRAALDWLGVPSVDVDLRALRSSLLDAPDVVRRVRAAMDEAGPTISLGVLARRLGLSVRSLQRHLAEADTSLRQERARHLVSRAERLLEGTELDLSAIAAELGMRSASHLVDLFRSARGVTPGAFRQSRRAASPTER